MASSSSSAGPRATSSGSSPRWWSPTASWTSRSGPWSGVSCARSQGSNNGPAPRAPNYDPSPSSPREDEMATTTATGTEALSQDRLEAMDAWWRAANYLSVGQIYLLDNPLLREALRLEHVKPRLLGHW